MINTKKNNKMKTKFVASALVMILATGMVMAQEDDKLGTDPELCKRSYTLYKEFHRQKNYADALPHWLLTTEICPKFATGVWSDGEKMFKARIASADDPLVKQGLIDSLMWVYDQRVKYFGANPRYPEGYILGNKGVALLKYRKEEVKTGYDILKRSVELQGKATKPPVVLTFMQASRQLFIDGLADAEQVLNDYALAMDVVDANLKDKPNDVLYTKAKEGIETHFTKSGAADCDALITLYEPDFEANASNEEWLKKISSQLRRAGCTDSELYVTIAEALYAVNPDAGAGHNLAVMFMKDEEFDKATGYLEKAIEIGQDSEELPDMYYELAQINYMHYKEYRTARQLCLQAVESRADWGQPYLLMGQIYIAAREEVFTSDFDQSTVFWAAVDKFSKAKRVDPEVADKANEMIRSYSDHFPNNELLFFHTLKEGAPYKVGGWINETTTIRSRKQ